MSHDLDCFVLSNQFIHDESVLRNFSQDSNIANFNGVTAEIGDP